MEIVPRPLSERVVRVVVTASTCFVVALGIACSLAFAHASSYVVLGSAASAAALAFGGMSLLRRSFLAFGLAATPTLVIAATAHEPIAHDLSASVGGALAAALLVRPLLRMHAATTTEGALDRFECVSLASSRSLFLAGVLAFISHDTALRSLGVVSLGAAMALVVSAMLRDRRRSKFLAHVYGNREPSYRIVRDVDVQGFELLPPILSGTITDAVLAHVHASTATYRSSDAPRPLARVLASLPKMLARIERRTRQAATLMAAPACCAALVTVMPLDLHASTSASHTKLASSTDAPACSDVGRYFEERLERVEGVGRAALLTHKDDATIGEHDGVVLVVPSNSKPLSDDVKARALAEVRAIPCSNQLSLTIESPHYRSFDVHAVLALEPYANEGQVLRDADEQVRELFQPNARAVYNEHVKFGASERLFGYRVRHVLRHVPGVKSVHLVIDGSDKDLPLAPRDFPTLDSLVLHATH